MTPLGLGLVDEVTNDLRPPLTVVKGSLETVLSNWEILDASQREELLGAALKSANELVSGVEMLEARLGAVERALDRDAPTSSLLVTLDT